MRVTIAATRHNKPPVGVVNDFSFALVYKGFSTRLVAHVNKFAVLDRERLDDFIIFRSENLAVND